MLRRPWVILAMLLMTQPALAKEELFAGDDPSSLVTSCKALLAVIKYYDSTPQADSAFSRYGYSQPAPGSSDLLNAGYCAGTVQTYLQRNPGLYAGASSLFGGEKCERTTKDWQDLALRIAETYPVPKQRNQLLSDAYCGR